MNDLLTGAHTATAKLPTYLLVRELNRDLGMTLVAYLANVRSRQLPVRWATDPEDPSHVEPRTPVKQRLQLVHNVLRALEQSDNEHTARQWLVGANPRLSGLTPADRIREFDGPAVFAAAEAFIEDVGGA